MKGDWIDNYIAQIGDGWLAFDDEQSEIGFYDTYAEAVDAIRNYSYSLELEDMEENDNETSDNS